jgi:AcrR family transcriptional regulator
MTIKTANKHELKTRETRALLLKAAETIFARDGYEGAELGEIAALAGRTKGAIYAQFKSKEDIFLALIEDRTQRYREKIEKHLAESKTIDENIRALRTFYLERIEDQAFCILLLEYKLYAMRHPESKKRLQKHYDAIFAGRDGDGFSNPFGAAATGPDGVGCLVAIQSMQSVISALVLEAQLRNALSDKDVVRKVIGRIFDALMEVPTVSR